MGKSTEDLRYLENSIDFENGVDQGVLAEKEVLVYSPEKTGTVTLFHTLGKYLAEKRQWPAYKKKLLHNHRKESVLNTIKATSPAITKSFLESRNIINDLIEYKRLKNQPVLVVSSFREPIERGISYVFQGLDKWIYIDQILRPEAIDYNKCKRQLCDFLTDRSFYHSLEEIYPGFFQKERFNKEDKCCLVDRGHLKILVVCLEHSDRWQKIFETELGYEGITIVFGNQASKKKIARMYSDFKKTLTLPTSVIRDAYFKSPVTKYMKWFYTRDEIDGFFQRSLERYGGNRCSVPAKSSLQAAEDPPLFSSDDNGWTAAQIEVTGCSAKLPGRCYTIGAKLTNVGDTIWLSGIPRKGVPAIALRAKTNKGKIITSNWHRLTDQVAPGQSIRVKTDFTIPEHSMDLAWVLDMVVQQVCWLSTSGTKAVPVDIQSAGRSDEPLEHYVKDLTYLEKIIDFEDGIDRGLISEKEIFIYAPGKTGTLSLLRIAGDYLSQNTNKQTPVGKLLLHGHSNTNLLQDIKILDPKINHRSLQDRNIVNDLIEYKRRRGKSLLIISSFREPLSRAISLVFQRVNNIVFVARSLSPEAFGHHECVQLLNRFLKDTAVYHPLEEIEPEFFTQMIFDKEKKYLSVDRGHYKIIVVCLEHSDRWATVFKTELGWDGIETPREHQTRNEMVADMYSKFKSSLTLPNSTIKSIYFNGPFARHLNWFYTDEEIDGFYRNSLERYGNINGRISRISRLPEQVSTRTSSFDFSKKTAAIIQLLDCTVKPGKGRYTITARLSNVGETNWLPGGSRKGSVALALRATWEQKKSISSNWYQLPHGVEPGETIDITADFIIKEDKTNLPWTLDLVAKDVGWFSESGTETHPVDLQSANELSPPESSRIDDLRYLEKVIDFEDGVDKGLMSKKEILIYSPGKTGTASLSQSVADYLSPKADKREPVENLLLHSHNNQTVLDNIKSIDPDIDHNYLKSRFIIRDLVEYKRLKDEPLIIVSSFREPLACTISGVFENIHQQAFLKKTMAIDDFNHEKCTALVSHFVQYFHHPIEEIIPDFFDQKRFDKDGKYLLVTREKLKILMVCLEHSDKWQEIFQTVLGFKGMEISVINRTIDKTIGQMYTKFKSNLLLPDVFIKKIYHGDPWARYLKWFYTNDEIDRFYKQALDRYGQITNRTIGKSTARAKGFKLDYSSDPKARTLAEIKLVQCRVKEPGRRYTIAAKLSNTGETVWLSNQVCQGTVAVALRAKTRTQQILLSDWVWLPEEVDPGQAILIYDDFTIPEGTADLPWTLDMVANDLYWFSDKGTVPVLVNTGSQKKPENHIDQFGFRTPLPESLTPYPTAIRGYLSRVVAFLREHPSLMKFAIFTCSLVPPLNRRIWAAIYNLPSGLEQQIRASQNNSFFHPETKKLPEKTQRILSRINALMYSIPRKTIDATLKRPTLAYISPLPPAMSGISYYSMEILPEMAKYYEITVIIDQTRAVNMDLPVRGIEWFKDHYRSFDRVMYHVGNSIYHAHMVDLLESYPGVIVLHDSYLGHLFKGMDSSEHQKGIFDRHLYLSHGYRALKHQCLNGRESAVWAFPLSCEIVNASRGVIVHSRFAHECVKPMCRRDPDNFLGSVPLANRIPPGGDRKMARTRLGFPDDLIVICCFGGLGPTKLNDRILNVWVSLVTAETIEAKLIFVGKKDNAFYHNELEPIVDKPKVRSSVSFTGEISAERFSDYLLAADAAVQLRSNTRGETSRSALECMAYALPIIINNHGSNQEIPDQYVVKIEDDFLDGTLYDRLLKLIKNIREYRDIGARAQRFIANERSPQVVANAYREQLESRYGNDCFPEHHMLASVADEWAEYDLSEDEIIQKAGVIAKKNINRRRNLYIDISEIVKIDRKTGIQRVLKNIIYNGVDVVDEEELRIEPVYEHDHRHYLARNYLFNLFGAVPRLCPDLPIEFEKNDLFLSLDFAINQHAYLGDMLQAMKRAGVGSNVVVHDLLPIFHSPFFEKSTVQCFTKWLHAVVKHADGIICVSRSVADELLEWIDSKPPKRSCPLKVGYFHLGAEIVVEALSHPNDNPPSLDTVPIHERPTVLMVGTIEPRKGYSQAIDAFDLLWQEGVDINLVIVGREGWLVDDFAKKLSLHPEQGTRLHWLKNANDHILDRLYKDVTLLLMASEGEGFGLPIVEAARHMTPVLARDLPVFREIAGEGALYFKGDRPEVLFKAIKKWLNLNEHGVAPNPTKIETLSWEQSTAQLFNIILNDNWYAKWDAGTARIPPG